MQEQTETFPVSIFPIRLGQFLKLANLVQDGLEAKILIQNGDILVNGLQEFRRGKKLYPDDTVSLGGKTWIIKAKNG
ncbi:MAG: RNA-binding S4 domain-containing protein [Desulforhopalus sp.]